ncbi:MAG: S9 family peptidase [Cyclobacteriaceae bacterium]
MTRFTLFILLFLASSIHSLAQVKKDPSFEEVISIKGITNPQLSPDGRHVLYQGNSTDWEENRFDTEIWMSRDGGTPFQLTNNPKKSSTNPKWSPDGKWIGFLSDTGDKTQIQVMKAEGGGVFQITNAKSGISEFEWSPDGSQIAFRQSADNTDKNKEREEKYGGFAVEDEEFNLNQLWLMNFNPELVGENLLPQQKDDSTFMERIKPRQLMDSVDFSIHDFKWSPNGKMLVFEHQPDPILISFMKRDISIYNLEDSTYNLLVDHPTGDGFLAWSPDSQSILYVTNLEDSVANFYKNPKFFRIGIDGKNRKQLATDFDEELYQVSWNDKGIFGVAWLKTVRRLVRVDPKNGKTEVQSAGPARIWSYSFSKDGSKIAYSASNDNSLAEIYTSSYPLSNPKKLTNSSNQLSGFKVAESEVISWPSEDGAMIEGVLHKPEDYDPNKKYPLLVVIHGGPTGISSPHPAPAYVYPILQWLNKGALVLRPNYRGSAGYGEAFRSLNVENLGVGDMWDVMSGVKFLEDKEVIDGDKVGSMGWSQGGYISAFLTTNTDKFKAISVGAGISNWMTYYVNTDIHPFTRQYLKATPWSDNEIYEKTSPMTNINNAKTPTLIQHGEFDKRVPTPNAYELFQGLQDVGVDTKLVIYKGFGHGITKPRERLAAMWHNWQWFGKYIWGEEIEVPE